MRTNFKPSPQNVTLLLLTLMTIGCVKAPDVSSLQVHMPKFEIPKIPDVDLRGLGNFGLACDKKDAEQPFSDEAVKNQIVITDRIENKDIEYIGCDGKVMSKTHGPEKYLYQTIQLPLPAELRGQVSYVSVENFRTCDKQSLDVAQLKPVQTLPSGEVINPNAASDLEAFELTIVDSPTLLLPFTTVSDGNNILGVSYWGKCLHYRDDKKADAKDSYNCLEAKLLGKSSILLKVNVARPEGAGTVQRKSCP